MHRQAGRIIRTVLSAAIALATTTAPVCAGDEPVTIRVDYLPRPDQVTVGAIAKRAVLQEFQKRHPEIRIERFHMPEALAPGSTQDTGPLMAIAAGMPPNAIFVNFRLSSTYIGEGFLKPLEPLVARLESQDPALLEIDAEGRFVAEPTPEQVQAAVELIRQRVPAPAWEVIYREDHTGRIPGKHVWAIPTSTFIKALLYRKDLFYASGLDPEHPHP